MTYLKFKSVRHSQEEFLAKASTRKGFADAYEARALEYQVADQMLKARSRAGLTQDAVAERMGTTKSAVSRLESAGKHAPSLATPKAVCRSGGLRIASEAGASKDGLTERYPVYRNRGYCGHGHQG